MKKLLCLVLVVFLFVGGAILPASAVDPADNNYYIGESNGYEIWWIDPQPEPALTDQIICDYWLTASSIYGALLSSPSAIYVIKGDDKIYIKQACEEGLVDPYNIAKIMNNFYHNGCRIFNMTLFGDTNQNGLLEMADVLSIQKIIAGKMISNSWLDRICDMDHNTEINLQDVLFLQKKIAKM